MDEQKLIATALSCGATKACVINQEQIVMSADFRKICESNQCGGYGRCWMCPPFIGEVEDLMEQVRRYPKGLWFQTIAEIEDSFDIEGMFEAGENHAKVSSRLRKAVGPLLQKPFLLLSCGGCHICPTCAKKEDKPCRFPEEALSSLEGYGIDVYHTTESTDLRYINGTDTVTYFGIVLFEE